MHNSYLLIPLFLGSTIAAPQGSPFALSRDPSSAICRTVDFSIQAQAQNRILLDPPTDLYSDIPAIIKFLTQDNGFKEVDGTYKIHGQYCTPKKQHPRLKAPLMLMVHGNTYDHTYFSGLNAMPVNLGNTPLPYSWIDYATKQGYYTLSIDRLGSGNSDHPDAVSDVQAPLQVATIAALIKEQLQPFDKIIYVGHSYGSILGTQLASSYPRLLDTYVMTGIAKEFPGDDPLPRQLASVHMQASVYDPQHFPPAIYTPGYLVPTNKDQRADTFYSTPTADYSQQLYDADFQMKDTITLGEVATQAKYVAKEYAGAVFVTTGHTDAVFCGNGTRLEADCERNGAPTQLDDFVAEYFPNASKRGTYIQQRAGHCAMLHHTWQDAVVAVHRWLENDGPKLPGPRSG